MQEHKKACTKGCHYTDNHNHTLRRLIVRRARHSLSHKRSFILCWLRGPGAELQPCSSDNRPQPLVSHWCFWFGGLCLLFQTHQPAADLPQPASGLLVQGLRRWLFFWEHVVVSARHLCHLLSHGQVHAGLGPQLRVLDQHREKGTCVCPEREGRRREGWSVSQARCRFLLSPSMNSRHTVLPTVDDFLLLASPGN